MKKSFKSSILILLVVDCQAIFIINQYLSGRYTTCRDPMDECAGRQTNDTHLWGFLLSDKQKRPPWQEVVFRIDENCGRLSPQGGDLVQMHYIGGFLNIRFDYHI